MQKILAIDYGRKRIGLAVCDGLGLTTRPLAAVDGENPERALAELEAHCREEEVEVLLIGLPLRMDGSEGEAVAEVRRFAERLRERVGLPVQEQDERLTSRHAHAVLKSAGVKHKQRRSKVDSSAALLLLQSFLAANR